MNELNVNENEIICHAFLSQVIITTFVEDIVAIILSFSLIG